MAAAGLLCAAVGASHAATQSVSGEPGRFGFGAPATAEAIAGWDIDVRPDGRGLPPGRGTVAEGQALYDAKCASCHGTFGESTDYLQLAGGVGSLASDQPIRTTGSKLNYATTLFDYIRRAMPFNAPKTLTDHEVYALTAYVLNLNDILPADGALDQHSIVTLRMPNRDGFTTDHGMGRIDGEPDTHNVACMSDCVAGVRVTSEIPAYARGSHGELAEQMRGGRAGERPGPVVVATAAPADGAALARKAACMTCHGVANAIVGPAFADVAKKYAGDAQAPARLAAKVRSGGAGVWGSTAMPAQSQVDAAEAERLVGWILGGAR